MVGPEAFTEVRYLAHAKQMQALDVDPRGRRRVRGRLRAPLGRPARAATGPRTPRRSSSRWARCSARSRTSSTSCARRASQIGALAIKSFRPFPLDEVRAALAGAKRVVVLEKALAVGVGGIVSANVRMALSGIELHGYTVVAGLGGRPITRQLAAGALRRGARRPARAAHLPRPRSRAGRGGARPDGSGRPQRPPRREHPARDRHRRREAALMAGQGATAPARRAARALLPGRQLRRRQPPARPRAAHRAGADASAPTASPPATAPARAAARRSAPATRSTRR